MNTIWSGSTHAVTKSNLFTFLLSWLPQILFVSFTLPFLVTKYSSWGFHVASDVHILFFTDFTSSLLSISYFFKNFTSTCYSSNNGQEFHCAIFSHLIFGTRFTLLLVFTQHSQWVSPCYGYSLHISSRISPCRFSSLNISRWVSTRYGLNSSGVEFRWEAIFSAPFQSGPGAHPASYKMGTGSHSRGKSGRSVAWPPIPI